MRNRVWYELTQAKHNQLYCMFSLAYRRKVLNIFNMVILGFSSAGIMGWTFWREFPLVSCVIVSLISLLKLISPHLVPSDKQIDKLDEITDFYFDYFNKLECLWFDFETKKINDDQLKTQFYKIKNSEKKINKSVNEIFKSNNKKLTNKAELESNNYLIRTFKL